MATYDELASGAPQWYTGISTILGRGKNDEALRQAREQQSLSQENTDKNGEFAAVRLIVRAQLAKGDAWNAEKSADEAVALAKSSGDKKGIAGAMHLLAKAQVAGNKPDEAMTAATEAEAGFKGIKFQVGVAAVMGTIASVHFAKKNLDKAIASASAGGEIFKELGDFQGQASLLKIAVDIKMSEDRYYHALLLVEQMVQLYNQASDAEGEAAAQLLAAELQVAQDDIQSAMDRASVAAELFGQVGNSKKKAAAVLVMARAFQGAEQFVDAAQAAEAACGLFQEARDKRGLGGALLIHASSLSSQSQFGAAAYKLEEAAFIFRQVKDKKEEARIMALLASTQVRMFNNIFEMPLQGWSDEDRENAAKNAARAVELLGEAGKKGAAEYGHAMLSHADVLLLMKARDAALDKAAAAQTIFEELGDVAGQGAALVIKGTCLSGQNKHDEAVEAMEKARNLAEEAGAGLSIKDVSQKLKDIGRYKAKASRPKSEGTRTDIDMILFEKPIITYDAFEGRSMRTGPQGSSSSGATPVDPSAVPQRQKVLYNLRMQRVPKVEMNIPQAITA